MHAVHRIFSAFCLSLCFTLPTFSQNIGDPYPNSLDIIRKGLEYYESGEYGRAAEEFGRVPDGDTLYVIAVYEKALSLSADSSYEAAYQTLEDLDEFRTNSRLDILILQAACLERMNRTDDARKKYDEILNEYGHSNRGYYERSVLEIESKNYEKAVADLTESLQLNPFHTSTHLNIGVLAAQSENYALAVMALFFATITNSDNAQLQLNLLSTIESIGSGEFEQDEEMTIQGSAFRGADELQDINEVILSKTALNSKYKSKVKPNLNYMKIMQITCEMLNGRAAPDNYLIAFYMNFYQKMWKEGKFIGMVVNPLRMLDMDQTNKIFKKYQKQSDTFVGTAVAHIEEVNKEVYYTSSGKKQTHTFIFEDSRVSGIGTLNSQGGGDGYWWFFHSNGELSAEGELRDNMRHGLWKFYDNRKTLIREETYNSNELDGEVRIYYPTGILKNEYTERNGKLEGAVREYHPNGNQESEYFVEGGIAKGVYTSYAASGYKETEMDLGPNQTPIRIRLYNSDGSIKVDAPLTDGKINGQTRYTHENGQTSVEGNMVKGNKEGYWKEYHENGQLANEGNFSGGKLNGEWKYYDETGRLYQTSEYTNDKVNGMTREYDQNGKLLSEITYRNGRGVEYTYYDEAGNKLIETKSSGGKLKIQTYNNLRYIQSEGFIEKDEREGPWKYYALNGSLSSECVYKDDVKDGLETEYFPTGEKSIERMMVEGLQQGFFKDYAQDGRLVGDGYALDGDRHGPFRSYHPNGKLATSNFYWKGQKNGREIEYGYNGEKLTETMYDNGVMLFIRTFDPTGAEVYTCHFDKGTGHYETHHIDGSLEFEAEMTRGNINGVAKAYEPDGSLESEVHWKYGRRHGPAVFYSAGKKTSEGQYENGVQHGEWIYYFSDGTVQRRMNYFQGDLEGNYKYYHPNGKVYQDRNYHSDERHGELTYYAEDGSMMGKLIYYRGVLVSYTYLDKTGKEVAPIPIKNATGKIKTYYQNGKVALEFEVVNGEYSGLYKTYLTNGKIRDEYPYEKGQLEGVTKEYYANGQPREIADYSKDNIHGVLRYYYDNGKLESEVSYVNDEKHGPATYYDRNGKVIRQGEHYYNEFFKK